MIEDILPEKEEFMMGNEAAVYGALLAGCNFFAAYPITPASDIPHLMARLMPRVGGRFIQMEDELSAIAAIIGASWTGARAMTATSGPGFSLMMENLGYAYMTETPIVIVDVQRAGPSTGQAGKAGQGDVMQARFGSHGDYEIIAVSPYSAEDYLWETIRAFALAEKYRTPVVVLSDAVVAHLREKVRVPRPEEVKVEGRKRPRSPDDKPFGYDGDDPVPPMPFFGEGYNLLITGSTHKADGVRDTVHREVHEELVSRLRDKIYLNRDDIVKWEEHMVDDAEYLVIAYGSPVRPALKAVKMAREKGIKVGLFVPKTLWPSPEERLMDLDVKKVLLPEMSLRGYRMEIERIFSPQKVVHLPKLSEVHTSSEIYDAIMKNFS